VEEILRVKNGVVAETTVFPKNGDTENGDTVIASTGELENQIDELVFQLYGLTTEERKLILG
jgi:hypothetical protein